MPMYHVEYDLAASEGTTEQEIREYLEEELDAENLRLTKTQPEFEAGWYQEKDALLGEAGNEVVYFSLDDLAYVGGFLDGYRRMNPPTPYEQAKYKDGYYEMADGFKYRRVNGVWELFLPYDKRWVMSSYDDDNIEEDQSIEWEHSL